jgi:hypothetical protein
MTNDDLKKTYWLGYLSGIINGISWRSDVPDEVKKICIEVISKYEKEFKKESL